VSINQYDFFYSLSFDKNAIKLSHGLLDSKGGQLTLFYPLRIVICKFQLFVHFSPALSPYRIRFCTWDVKGCPRRIHNACMSDRSVDISANKPKHARSEGI
jgi:hypothetical protein